MLIDWFTVVAQALNFLILVWLLKRFLYQPVLKAIEEREEKIKTRISEAESQKEQAEEERNAYRRQKRELEEQRDELLEKAHQEAREERRKLLQAARTESEALRTRLRQSIREEYETLHRDLRARLQDEVFAVARKVLDDLASESLEKHMADTFLRRLTGAEADQRTDLAAMLRESGGQVLIRSAFGLPAEQQDQLEQALGGIAGQPVDVQFEEDPGKISGVELTAGGYKMAWSIADYLQAFEDQLADWLETHSPAEPAAPSQATSDETTG
jgi:F-type H+-transporting ATPase subunit b